MHIIPLVDFGSIVTQLLGGHGCFLLLVDCEFIIAILANRSSKTLGDIEVCSLWLRTSDEGW